MAQNNTETDKIEMYSIRTTGADAEVQRRVFLLLEEAYGKGFRERAQDWNQYDRMLTIAAENGIEPVPANAAIVAHEVARSTVGSVSVHLETLEFQTDRTGRAIKVNEPHKRL